MSEKNKQGVVPSDIIDPEGKVASYVKKLNPKCAVAISVFRDHIIAMRMRGATYQAIENALVRQGMEYRISAATIWKSLQPCKMEKDIPESTKLIESYGGSMKMDVLDELSRQVMIQKRRVDKMLKAEADTQKTSASYINPTIKDEVKALNDLLKTYMEAAKPDKSKSPELENAAKAEGKSPLAVPPSLEDKIVELILTQPGGSFAGDITSKSVH